MRIVQYEKHGGPEVLELLDRPAPEPRPGELLIEVHAVSVNPIDWKMRAGRISQLPASFPAGTGRDGAGLVMRAGNAENEHLLGSRVCFLAPRGIGTWSDILSLPVDCLAPIPSNLSFVDGAALPLAGISAWAGLVGIGHLRAGMRVLIHGGSGGVGSVAVQLARHLGAEVAATCSENNADYVRGLGAHQVIPYDKLAFETVVHDVDLVFDLVGGDAHHRSYGVLRPGGTLVYLNAAPIVDRSSEFGVRVVMAQVLPDRAALSQVLDLFASGTFRPIVDQVLPFEAFRVAQERSEHAHCPGKIVLTLR
jgi:NADPH:quinone reductase-like Zn-dependent oxidoreductase